MSVKINFEGNKHISYNHVVAVCELGNWIQIIGDNGEHVEYQKGTFDSIELHEYNV